MQNTGEPTGRLLLKSFRAFENLVLARLNERRFTDITPSHLNLIRHLEPQGMRLSALARDAALSKAAVGKIAAELRAKGYVIVEADQNDARAKTVRFSAKGKRMIDAAVDIVIEIETMFQNWLGKQRYSTLRADLELLWEKLTDTMGEQT